MTNALSITAIVLSALTLATSGVTLYVVLRGVKTVEVTLKDTQAQAEKLSAKGKNFKAELDKAIQGLFAE